MKTYNSLYYSMRQDAHINRKGMTDMDIIEKYIDYNLINEYADKNQKHGYLLDIVSSDITDHERSNFLDILFKNDPIIRPLILDRMQELIDQRLYIVELKDRHKEGFKPVLNDINGVITWVRDIKTTYDCKPIPLRDWDWLAYREDDDPEDKIYGYGATEKEAIDALIEIEGN
jgi:hypothetical protein